jgi:hypothetical protein
MTLVISWTAVIVFVATAIGAVLSMFRIVKLDEGVAGKLYTTLVVEVVIISLAVFGGFLNIEPGGKEPDPGAAKPGAESPDAGPTAARGSWYAVLASVPNQRDALDHAAELDAKHTRIVGSDRSSEVHVYKARRDGDTTWYAVTLGGPDNQTMIRRRVDYAVANGLAPDAYPRRPDQLWGPNLR